MEPTVEEIAAVRKSLAKKLAKSRASSRTRYQGSTMAVAIAHENAAWSRLKSTYHEELERREVTVETELRREAESRSWQNRFSIFPIPEPAIPECLNNERCQQLIKKNMELEHKDYLFNFKLRQFREAYPDEQFECYLDQRSGGVVERVRSDFRYQWYYRRFIGCLDFPKIDAILCQVLRIVHDFPEEYRKKLGEALHGGNIVVDDPEARQCVKDALSFDEDLEDFLGEEIMDYIESH